MQEINAIQRALLRGLGKNNEGCSVTKLAIPAVDRLETFGLVRRMPATAKGAAATVKVTEKGRELLAL